MNSKFRPFYLLAFLLFVAYISIFRFNNPPNGVTGAPGDGLCTDCHNPPSAGQNGNVQIAGLPATIMPNTTYSITITDNNPDGAGVAGGFQMVVLDGSNSDVGALTNASSSSTITPSGGRTYWEHNPAKNFGAGTSVSWTVDWTSPAGPDGETITMYGAGNITNGNGSTSGDLVVTTTSSGIMDVPAPPLVAVIIDSMDISCNGGDDGSATASATGGTMPYTYAWSNGQNGANLVNVMGGTYTVTVTDNDNTQATASVTLDQPATAVTTNIQNVVNVSCFGLSDGNASANPAGGTPPYSYTWSNGQNTQNLVNVIAGDYTVTVTDQNLCEATAMVTITQPEILLLNTLALNNVDCNGNATGSATVGGQGGTPPYTYQWSNGTNGPAISNVVAGPYTVTVTDQNNCMADAVLVIEEPDALTLDFIGTQDVSCFGGDDGSTTAEVNGGIQPYNYLWSNGQNQAALTGLEAGTYTLTVTDLNNCEIISSVTITEPDSLVIALGALVHPACNGDTTGSISISVSGGTPNYSYSWSNGSSVQDQQNLPQGTYSVTVTDANDCETSMSFDLVEPDALVLNLSTTDETAVGAADGTASINPMGGTMPYTLAWSNGGNGTSIMNLAPGPYEVTLTDQNQCSLSEAFVINAFGCALNVSDSLMHILCAGDSAGAIYLEVTGAAGTPSIIWNNGEMTEDITGLAAGSYSVTVSDTAGCEFIGNYTITEPEELSLNVSGMNVSAPGMNDGSATAMVTGGVMPYAYLWSTGDTTAMISDLSPDDYQVTVTDANGCEAIDSVRILDIPCALALDSLISRINCADSATGEICVIVTGGARPYLYNWGNGNTMDSCLSDLGEGMYSVTVTDQNGCEISANFRLDEPDSLVSLLTVMDATCNGGSNGSAMVQVSGGTPPYSVEWSNDSTGNSIENLQAGFYGYVVTDQNGCMVFETFTVNQPNAIQIMVDSVIDDDLGTGDGAIFITVSGGTPPYSYTWRDEGDQIVGMDMDLEGVEAGYYSVEILDDNECQAGRDSIKVETMVPTVDPEKVTSIRVFPNPASSMVEVNILLNESSSLNYTIVNMLGERVMQEQLPSKGVSHNLRLPVSDLDAGIYYIILQLDGERAIRRIVKQ